MNPRSALASQSHSLKEGLAPPSRGPEAREFMRQLTRASRTLKNERGSRSAGGTLTCTPRSHLSRPRFVCKAGQSAAVPLVRCRYPLLLASVGAAAGLLVGCALREPGAPAPSPQYTMLGAVGGGVGVWPPFSGSKRALTVWGEGPDQPPGGSRGSPSPAPLLPGLGVARPAPEEAGLLCVLRASGRCARYRPCRSPPRSQWGAEPSHERRPAVTAPSTPGGPDRPGLRGRAVGR